MTLRHSHSHHINEPDRKEKFFSSLQFPQYWFGEDDGMERGRLEIRMRNMCKIDWSRRVVNLFFFLSSPVLFKGYIFHPTLHRPLANGKSYSGSDSVLISIRFSKRFSQSEKEEEEKVEISFGDDIKRTQNEKISKIIKELPGIENAKKKFFPLVSLQIFFISFWFST